MSEFENETAAAAVETPPEEKADKPARKPRKAKAEKAAEESVAEAKPNGDGEQAQAAAVASPPAVEQTLSDLREVNVLSF